MSRGTTYADRKQFVELHLQGKTYLQIVEQTGWDIETVRHPCRGGHQALQPKRRGRPPRGCLSTFAPSVRFALLRVKRQHPAWGPAVVLDELRQQRAYRHARLPGVSQLGSYYHRFGARLVQLRAHRQLPPELASPAGAPFELVYQLDSQERQHLPRIGDFNVVNLRAPQWGVTLGSYVHVYQGHAAGAHVNLAGLRADCRKAFQAWGLPDVLQTDHDSAIVAHVHYPFPSDFTL
jgi:hypothetical protein